MTRVVPRRAVEEMAAMSKQALFILAGLATLGLAGCLSPVRQEVDALVCHRASVPVDLLPPRDDVPAKDPKVSAAGLGQAGSGMSAIQLVGGKDEKGPKKTLQEKLEPPPGIPGAEVPRIKLPKNYKDLSPKEQEAFWAKYFPPQLPMGPDPSPVPGPDGKPLTLSDLQRLARENSPPLRQAASDIAAAEGAVVQAAVYNNPVLGYATTPVSFTSGNTTAPSITQTIPVMGKRKLAEAAAKMDLANAQLAYRRAETDLMASVRTSYYSVLAAQKSMIANKALADLTDEVYKVMLVQQKVGEFAAYEPMQLGVYAAQSRIALIQSRNAYLLAWRQLAVALGLPLMQPTEIDGNIDSNMPRFDYEKLLATVLANHTDVLTARNGVAKARYNLRLAEVTPYPDVTLGMALLYDASTPGPPRLNPMFTGSMALPIFDRNQGGIKQAQAALMRAIEEPHRVQASLTASVADAYRRLDENRRMLDLFRKQMLPQQVHAFRGAVARHFSGDVGGVAFTDLVTAEQNLVTLIPSYLTALQAYWQAVSDVASLLQTDDVYEMASEVETVAVPDLAQLLKLPCCHPCSSLPGGGVPSLSFESPPGRPVAPEFGEQPAPPKINAPTQTPSLLKETLILPQPVGLQPTGATLPVSPAASTPGSGMPARLGPLTVIPASTPSEAGRN
jgi:cobalt-zinc-cadmium efflux system outer membrane protein